MEKIERVRILFLPQRSDLGAASRVRLYEYLSFLDGKNIHYRVISGTTSRLDRKMSTRPTVFIKICWFLSLFLNRLRAIFYAPFFDVIFLQKETMPYLFPLIDLLLITVSRRSVFDFDDAIFNYGKTKGFLKKMFFDKRNIARIIERCDRIIVSNAYLLEYAKQFHHDVRMIPTSILRSEYDGIIHRNSKGAKPVIGWIGSESTAMYINMVRSPLMQLAKKYAFVFRVVGVENVSLEGVSVESALWKKERQIDDLGSFDIGIMPLTDDSWTRGKAGFKLLQYMGAGVAAVASPVGVNREIIEDGVNGFLAEDEQAWVSKLEMLLTKSKLRHKLALAGRRTVFEHYTLEKNVPRWVEAITAFE